MKILNKSPRFACTNCGGNLDIHATSLSERIAGRPPERVLRRTSLSSFLILVAENGVEENSLRSSKIPFVSLASAKEWVEENAVVVIEDALGKDLIDSETLDSDHAKEANLLSNDELHAYVKEVTGMESTEGFSRKKLLRLLK